VRPVGPRDDRLLPETRRAALVVTAILIPALVILWGLPGRTDELWAWTIKPEMTAIFMGSGYGAGAYFFARRAVRGGRRVLRLGRRLHRLPHCGRLAVAAQRADRSGRRRTG
jgi:hypothetical protein